VKVAAPGKLMLTGAYAVLEGAPAIVMAVDRYALADSERVDVSALCSKDGVKLGLGSSAAQMVARLGYDAAKRGEDLASSTVRARIFADARAAHAKEQSGGSGFDIAAAVYGGVLRYQLLDGAALVESARVPDGVHVATLWSGAPARTCDLRAKVDGAANDGSKNAAMVREARRRLGITATHSDDAATTNDAAAFVAATGAFGAYLKLLGGLAGAALFPSSWYELHDDAFRERAVFIPSGAGGGDCGVWIGLNPPSDAWLAHARELGFQPLSLATDRLGVRVVE
jgi:phosphomevalonate kinase